MATILERIKDRAVELLTAAQSLIDDVEAAEAALSAVVGGLVAQPRGERKSRRPGRAAPRRAEVPAAKQASEALTHKELRVKELLDKGTEPKEAAKALGMGLSNVYLLRKKYSRKLGIVTRKDRQASRLDALIGTGRCGKCGLRGEHDCIKGDAAARSAEA